MVRAVKHFVRFALLTTGLLPAAAHAADKRVVAIVPFEAPRSVQGRDLGTSAMESFSTQLIESKKVRVVERNKLDRVFKEHELNMSGFVDPATIKKAIGKGLAVDFLVMGRISDTGDGFSLSARLVNLESSEIEVAKEVPFRDVSSLRVAVKSLTKQFVAEVMGETASESAAETFLNTDSKHFYAAAEALADELSRMSTLVEGEVSDLDTSAKRVTIDLKTNGSEIPPGTKLEVFRDDVGSKKRVAELFVVDHQAGEKTAVCSYLKSGKGSKVQLGDTVSSRQYKLRVALGPMVDEAEDNEKLIAKFKDTVGERLSDMANFSFARSEEIDALLAKWGSGNREQTAAELFKLGVDVVVTGKFIGRPGDRRTDFKVYSAHSGKIRHEAKFDTRL